jgi:hypothetical protein
MTMISGLRMAARRALTKLPDSEIRRGAMAFPDNGLCFVSHCIGESIYRHLDDRKWARWAQKYELTWDGRYMSVGDNGWSDVSALSAAFECDHTWFRGAVKRRLARRALQGVAESVTV